MGLPIRYLPRSPKTDFWKEALDRNRFHRENIVLLWISAIGFAKSVFPRRGKSDYMWFVDMNIALDYVLNLFLILVSAAHCQAHTR